MFLKNLSLINFKNYKEANFIFSEDINYIVGQNGSGKTNLLDAIYYLSFCKSFVNSLDSENILHNTSFFVIQGTYLIPHPNGESNNNFIEVFCGVKDGERKHFKLNNKEYTRLADHIGLIPLVLISPADSILISGGSEERRKFLDSVISQFDKSYLNDLITYNKALIHRNLLLKQFAQKNYFDTDSLELLNEKLIATGLNIYTKRKHFISEFIPIFHYYYEFISAQQEKVDVIYQSQLQDGDFKSLLEKALVKDKIFQWTTVGIHKDDLFFKIEDSLLKRTASEGQKKTFTIALNFAKYTFIKKITNLTPILLLDDIFDKLDADRVKKIVELICSPAEFLYPLTNNFNNSLFNTGQVFITDTSEKRIMKIIEQIAINRDNKIYKVPLCH